MNKKRPKPPRIAAWILGLIARRDDEFPLFGDFNEEFNEIVRERGVRYARFWYRRHLMRSLPSIIRGAVVWRLSLMHNYLSVSVRNILHNKGYSFINIAGLALGMTAFLFFAAWILHELSYDKFHENAPYIYRVNEKLHYGETIRHSARTPGLLSPELARDFPEIRYTARHAWTGKRVVSRNDVIHYEQYIACVDPAFLNIFSLPLIKGSRHTALNDPYSMVITEKTALKYFGDKDPVGKTLLLDNRIEFTITGVMKNTPSNSHLYFDMLVPFEIVGELGWLIDSWEFGLGATYVCLNENTDAAAFEEKIAWCIRDQDADSNIELYLQPFTDIYLGADSAKAIGSGRIQYVYIFSIISLLIITMACINFINLSTARSETRAKEIGVRKVIGAGRRDLIRQLLTETVVLAFAALILSIIFIAILLPQFNKLTGESFTALHFLNRTFIPAALIITLLTGLLSGAYPALYLSSLQPLKGIKKNIKSGTRASVLRKGLVLIQICISLLFIISTGILYSQIDFLRNKDLGFDKEHIVSIPLGISNSDNFRIYRELKTSLKQIPGIVSVTGAFTHPLHFGTHSDNVVFKDKRLDENIPVGITSVDFGYIETLNIEILKDRSFSPEYGSER